MLSAKSEPSLSQEDQQAEKETRTRAGTCEDGGNDPINWPRRKKLTMIGLVMLADVNDAMGSSVFAPVVYQVSREFHTSSPSIASLLISVHVIGYIAGPLILSPLSEMYGRRPLLHGSNVAFVVATVICMLSVDIPMMIIGRIFMGLAGSVPATVGAGVISDLIPLDERGYAVSLWANGQLLGIVFGPIIGGYISMNLGWRWTFRLMAILSGCSTVLTFLLLRETYSSPRGQAVGSQHGHTGLLVVQEAISRPCRLFIRSPLVSFISLYGATAYVYMYSTMSTFPEIFPDHYGFKLGEVGLVYLGQGIGFWVAQFFTVWFSNWYPKRRRTHQKSTNAEDRLPLLVAGCCVLAIGMFWYGWSVEGRAHWAILVMGTAVIGIGCLLIFVSVQLYLIDAFPTYPVSASALAIVIRSVFGATLPMAMPSLHGLLGYGWGNTVLGCLTLALVPILGLISKRGEKLRTSTGL